MPRRGVSGLSDLSIFGSSLCPPRVCAHHKIAACLAPASHVALETLLPPHLTVLGCLKNGNTRKKAPSALIFPIWVLCEHGRSCLVQIVVPGGSTGRRGALPLGSQGAAKFQAKP